VTEQTPIEIDIIADFTCPWSFIGKKRLEATLDMLGTPAKVTWYPYLQAPDIPPGGVSRKEWLARTYGTPEQIAKALEPVKVAGLQDGIEFNFDAIKVMPSTIDAHRLMRWARGTGKENDLAERIYRLFFVEGQDIGDIDVLADAAADVGLMDKFKARKMLESDMDLEEMWQEVHEARELGLKMVPAYIIARKYAILGAEDPISIAKAIQTAQQEAEMGETQGEG